jgi:hypothetical protein
MNVTDISNEIMKKVQEIDKIRAEIRSRGDAKAHKISEYEKKLAVTMIMLKNGKSLELDGEMIADPGATITEKIAKGICYKEKLEMEQAEALYKSAVVNLESVMSQMTALQSIFRHLDKV